VAEVCGDAATGTVVGEAATTGRETAEGGGGGTYVGTQDVEKSAGAGLAGAGGAYGKGAACG